MHKEKLIAVNSHFQLQWEEKQNAFVLLYPEGMVQLNQSAGEILNLCNGKNNFYKIVTKLEEKFNMSGLNRDVEAFLQEAIKRDWIEYYQVDYNE